jgi:3-oxoacyl-[acyl-carrier-protein] synthase III
VVTLHLHGLGHFHPENEITNAFLEALDIGTDPAWILERTGIHTRRTVLPLDYIRTTRNREPRAALEAALFDNAELGRRAAELAIARAGIARERIGMVIAGTSAADTASPAEACNVAHALGLEVPAFDVTSACTSFLAQLHLLVGMREDTLPDFVLLVVPEGLTRTVDYADRSAAVLWGDGAAAAVVSTRVPGRARIAATSFASSPQGAGAVSIPRLGHFRQQGRAVQAFAIRHTIALFEQLRGAHADAADRTLHFVGHQANLRMLESVCRSCAIPPERHHHNVEWFGNTAAASGASVVSMAWDKWTPQDDVALAAVGAGLSWGSALLRFDGASA